MTTSLIQLQRGWSVVIGVCIGCDWLEMAANASLCFPLIKSPEHRLPSFPSAQEETCHCARPCVRLCSLLQAVECSSMSSSPPAGRRLALKLEQNRAVCRQCSEAPFISVCCVPKLDLLWGISSWDISPRLLLNLLSHSWQRDGVTSSHQFALLLSQFYDVLKYGLCWPFKVEMFIKSSSEALFIL